MGLLNPESYRKGILWSSAFNVCGRSVAFVQHWLVGFYFGTFADTDVFFFTYNIILFISYFFLNFTVAVLVPKGINLRVRSSEHDSVGFFNGFLAIYALLGLALFLLAGVFTTPLFSLLSSFPEHVVASNMELIRWCLPIVFLNIVISLMTEIMASYKYFTFPNTVNLINSTLGVVFILLFHDVLGLRSVAMGLVLGYLVNLLILVLSMKRLLKWRFSVCSFSKVKEVMGSGAYSQLGYSMYLVALYVPQYLLSKFPEGSLTAVAFADKMVSVPSIFLVAQITNVMAIKFNNLVSANQFAEVARLAEKLLLSVMTGLFVVAIGISLASEWMVDLLFGMGKFSADSLELTSLMLSMLIMYLPFSFAYNLFMRIFNAYQKQKVYAWVQLATQGLIIALYCWLIPAYGLVGYPLSLALPYITVAYFVVPLFKRYCPEMRVGRYYAFLVVFTVVFAVYYYHAFFA